MQRVGSKAIPYMKSGGLNLDFKGSFDLGLISHGGAASGKMTWRMWYHKSRQTVVPVTHN